MGFLVGQMHAIERPLGLRGPTILSGRRCGYSNLPRSKWAAVRALSPYEGRTSLESTVVDIATQGIEAGDNEAVVAEKVGDNLAAKPGYVSLAQAQTLLAKAIDAARPSPPKVLTFLKSGEQELRVVNYSINAGLIGLSMFLAATQLGSWNTGAAGPSLLGAVKGMADQGWLTYEYMVDAHPILCKVRRLVLPESQVLDEATKAITRHYEATSQPLVLHPKSTSYTQATEEQCRNKLAEGPICSW